MAHAAGRSFTACPLASNQGYGAVRTAELAGEIGTVERFRGEASLALHLGMATLDNSSGKFRGSKAPKHVNVRAKAAMMAAVDHHRKRVRQSRRYFGRTRAEGKKHNQAIRALGQHIAESALKDFAGTLEDTRLKYEDISACFCYLDDVQARAQSEEREPVFG